MRTKFWIFLLVLAALFSSACYALEANRSGAWYDPDFEGAGFLIEVLSDGRAVVYWFTYDNAGSQQWYVGTGDTTDNLIVIDELQAATGGRFGPEFDPDSVTLSTVGSLIIEFAGCADARVDFTVNGQAGHQALTRLTSIDGLDCADNPPAHQLHQSASWFNADRSGEGFVVQVLDSQTAFIIFFTFTDAGDPRWFSGIGYVAGHSLVVQDLLLTSGGRFDSLHDPAAVVRERAGRLELYLGCSQGRVSYDMEQPLPSDGHDLERLTQLGGPVCQEDFFTEATLDSLIGIWQSDGFATSAQVTAETVMLFQTTEVSCVKVFEAPISALAESVGDFFVNQTEQRLRFAGLDAVTPVFFDRADRLPQACHNGPTPFTDDPSRNYEVFAATYAERYADFSLSNVDWLQQQTRFGPMVSAATTPQRLFNIFSQMLAPLRDLHTTIDNESQFYSSGLSASRLAYFNRAQGPEVDQIIGGYLSSRLLSAASGAVQYGMLQDGSGYLELRTFTINNGGENRDQRLNLYGNALDRVFDYFHAQEATKLVVDVRRNGGGDSAFGFQLASRFLRGQTRTLFSERRPGKVSLTRPYVQQLLPSTRITFNGNVVLLTGPITGSAAEIFVLAMRASPHITLIGAPTAGILSRTERVLPNGWRVSLTGGQIRTPEGDYFERRGIPVELPASVFTDEDYSNGIDSALELAMAHLGR